MTQTGRTAPAFTPGRWRSDPRIDHLIEHGRGWQSVTGPKGEHIARVNLWGDAPEEGAANAALLREAPAMHEALRALMSLASVAGMDSTIIPRVREVLARIDGVDQEEK